MGKFKEGERVIVDCGSFKEEGIVYKRIGDMYAVKVFPDREADWLKWKDPENFLVIVDKSQLKKFSEKSIIK